MKTFYSYFRGGNGAGLGAEAAGYVDLGGVEYEPAIAAACDVNFPDSLTTIADVCAVDPATLLTTAPTWFHASPSCVNASVAKTGGGEVDQDRDAGQAVARFISHWQPEYVSIENVWQYRTFNAFLSILACLSANGYSYEYWHLNSANYGVAQTRKRLILVAKRGMWRIQRPEPTHCKNGDMWLPAWIGWYAAIFDLIPTLPESAFAPWQEKRLPAALRTNVLCHPNADNPRFPCRDGGDPSFTITTFQAGLPRAFILSNAKTEYGDGIRDDLEPCHSVTSQSGGRTRAFLMRSQNTQQVGGNQVRHEDDPAMCITAKERPRAFVMDSRNTDHERSDRRRSDDEPIFTVTAIDRPSHMPRAFLVGGANTSDDQSAPGVGVSEADEPTRCVNASNSQQWRAFVVDGSANDRGESVTIRHADEPMMTVTANGFKRKQRAWLSQGRVVAMTPRALAVFQSFPRTYVLPDKTSLACKIIGNATPPLLMQRIGEHF